MINVANAPCSWGVIEKTFESARSGDYRQVLDEMQVAGFRGTELGDWGFMPTDPVRLKDELDKRELSLVGSWVTAVLIDRNSHQESAQRAIRTAGLLAAVSGTSPLIILGDNLFAYDVRNRVAGRVTKRDSMTADQWTVFTDGLHSIAQKVKAETGIRTVFHHHCSTWIEAPWEISRLLELTDPELIGLCLDTGHYRYGGGEPIDCLKRHADRIRHVHFKDCDVEIATTARNEKMEYNTAVGKGLFCELGTGEVDFRGIFNELQAIGYEGWIVVEQDVLPNMGSPKEMAVRNREYLRGIGL
jgi:inosose dehydratase